MVDAGLAQDSALPTAPLFRARAATQKKRKSGRRDETLIDGIPKSAGWPALRAASLSIGSKRELPVLMAMLTMLQRWLRPAFCMTFPAAAHVTPAQAAIQYVASSLVLAPANLAPFHAPPPDTGR